MSLEADARVRSDLCIKQVFEMRLATAYSPTPLPVQYHRRLRT